MGLLLLMALLPSQEAEERKFRKLLLTLETLDATGPVKPLLDLMDSPRIPRDLKEGAAAAFGAVCDAAGLGSIFDRAIASGSPLLLEALASAAREREVRPAGDLLRLGPLLERKDPAALSLAGAWRLEELRPAISKAAIEGLPEAIGALESLGGPASVELLGQLASKGRPFDLRVRSAAALAALDLKGAASLAAEILGEGAEGEVTPIFASFVRRQGGGEALAAALKDRKIGADFAKLGLRHLYTLGLAEPALINILRPAAAITAELKELPAEELKRLMEEVAKKGDAARGEAVFRRRDIGCLGCHAIGGTGGQVGPDLAGLGTASTLDYIIESVVVPGKLVKEGFESAIVLTKDGEVHTGIVKGRSDEDLSLRNAMQDDFSIALSRIEKEKPAGSLMPAGLADSFTRGELLDLSKFLSTLGKEGYSVSSGPVVRRWRMLEPVPAGVDPAAARGPWVPIYSRISGELPLAELAKAKGEAVSYVQFEVEVTSPGAVGLKLDSKEGLRMWHNGAPVTTLSFDLARGVHRFTLRVAHGERGATLRAELEEIAGSPARFHPVGGK